MKKIIYILFLLSLVFGCKNQRKESKFEKSAPVSVEEVKEIKKEDTEDIVSNNVADSLNFKLINEINTSKFNQQKIANQKIQQVLDIALLMQKDNIDSDLKNHALDYAKKLFIAKDEQLLKEVLNSIKLKNIDSILVKDLIQINEQKISDSKKNTTLKFNLYVFKNGKTSILKKTAKLQIIKEETVLDGQSFISYKTRLIALF